MAIVIFVAAANEGYGDFAYGLRMATGLQKKLAEQFDYRDEIILVSYGEGIEKFKKLGAEKLGFKVLDQNQFDKMRAGKLDDFSAEQKITSSKPLTVDYYFEVYSFTLVPFFQQRPSEIWPACIFTEIAYIPPVVSSRLRSLKNENREPTLLKHGFAETEDGILREETLAEYTHSVADEKNAVGRAALFAKLNPKLKTYLNPNSDTPIFFEYSQDQDNTFNPEENFTEFYLQYVQIMISGSGGNKDVVCVGQYESQKMAGLRKILPDLKKDGFKKIVFVNVEKNTAIDIETGLPVIYQEGDKVFRVLYEPTITHDEVMALMVLSSPPIGCSGDGTSVEALQVGNIVYEARSYKEGVLREYLAAVKKLAKNAEVYELAELSWYGYGDMHRELNPGTFARLNILLHKEEVVHALGQINQQIVNARPLLGRLVTLMQSSIVDAVVRAASSAGDIDRIKKLFEKLHMHVTDADKLPTVVKNAIETKSWFILEALLLLQPEFKLRENIPSALLNELMEEAMKRGFNRIVALLLQENSVYHYTDTPRLLYLAVIYNRKDTISVLLKQGADINAEDEKGNTPLFMAANNGDTELVVYLIEQGADPNLPNRKKLTPLALAIDRGFASLTENLLEYADEKTLNTANEGDTPLFRMIESTYSERYTEHIRKIWQKNIRYDHVDNNQQTALHLAAKTGQLWMLELFITKIDPALSDKNGDTALALTVNKALNAFGDKSKYQEAAQFLFHHQFSDVSHRQLFSAIIKPGTGFPMEAIKNLNITKPAGKDTLFLFEVIIKNKNLPNREDLFKLMVGKVFFSSNEELTAFRQRAEANYLYSSAWNTAIVLPEAKENASSKKEPQVAESLGGLLSQINRPSELDPTVPNSQPSPHKPKPG